MKKTVAVLLALLMIAVVFCACDKTADDGGNDGGNTPDLTLYNEIIASQEAYLKTLQLDCGAFTKWTQSGNTNEICPYFACFAALALLENADNAQTVKKYLDWHFSALNKDGDYNEIKYTIYDYKVETVEGETVLTAKNSYDSTDSYAALFLAALEKYYAETNDVAYITSHETEIKGVYGAMLSTYSDGLTYAKPDYEIKYLMDNSEVYFGLTAAKKLFAALNDTEYCALADGKLEAVGSAISKLYIKSKGLYAPYLGTLKVDTEKMYPDMAAQLYPVTFGAAAATDEISVSVFAKFKESFGTVESFTAAVNFPWMILAYSAVRFGDVEFATALLENAKEKYMSSNAYPWYSMEGACSLLAASAVVNVLS